MTTLAPESLVSQHIELTQKLQAVLREHPLGGGFRLLVAPRQLELADDEVLVQAVDPAQRTVELRPCKIAEMDADAVLHATQVLDPCDQALWAYAAQLRRSTCGAFRRGDGSTGHLYAD
ncbi:hypothetical protein [Streptomyces kanamyceticus]|uniref:Uncharacterized protein n=1 Tax=Streptomyces kanamyceticus TaxID=1967 RepID=A0A5J6GC06_STRKN|nr:hypothetical protein [Streptomyces kanamyceticus]QEU93370.1 hypothetical protein CP970_22815 [Streptomyces kanamyceticus]